jgi:PadR family transcriptional regulator
MVERRSAQTLAVLGALADSPAQWWHGYDIAKRTGLKSGTLYPILIRLAERGLLESSWEEEQPAGRPRRHLYRLTADGLAASAAASAVPAPAQVAPAAKAARAAKAAPATKAAADRPARVRPRLVGEGS